MTITCRVGFIKTLLHPLSELCYLARSQEIPLADWAVYFAIAVGGSLFFGAGMALRLGAIDPSCLRDYAWWFCSSAGAAWCIFGPVLIATTRVRPLMVAHCCMVTMVYGEAVLISGALFNLLVLSLSGVYPSVAGWLDARGVAWTFVIVANIIMSIALAKQMQVFGVRPGLTVLLWHLVLNPVGAVFFHVFSGLLGG